MRTGVEVRVPLRAGLREGPLWAGELFGAATKLPAGIEAILREESDGAAECGVAEVVVLGFAVIEGDVDELIDADGLGGCAAQAIDGPVAEVERDEERSGGDEDAAKPAENHTRGSSVTDCGRGAERSVRTGARKLLPGAARLEAG